MKCVLGASDKGGVGKTLAVSGAVELVPDIPILEVDAARRLLAYGDRVRHYPMRASREDIEKSGGKAARGEFDAVSDALMLADRPLLCDVGANTGRALLQFLFKMRAQLERYKVEPALLVVVTAQPEALVEAHGIIEAGHWIKRRFIVENRRNGPVPEAELAILGKGATVTAIGGKEFSDEAREILDGGGLASIAKLDAALLEQRFGPTEGGRILEDLQEFRLDVMQAMQPVAKWLIS